jgi:hypothetical protein
MIRPTSTQADQHSVGMISGESERRLSGEGRPAARADHAAASRSSDGSDTIQNLCHGCDTPLGPDRFCASCNEIMETYQYPEGEPAAYARKPSRIEALLAKPVDAERQPQRVRKVA